MTIENFKEGDIFSWCWVKEIEDRKYLDCASTAYWCKSRIAVFLDGVLRDTYWGAGSSERLDPAQIVLTFKGNMHEMKVITAEERVFYRGEDIVDMNHSNNSRAPVYAKASRDPETMKEYFSYQMEKSERDIEWSRRRIKECQDAIARVENGEIEGNFCVYN